jgi:hypothetical protein
VKADGVSVMIVAMVGAVIEQSSFRLPQPLRESRCLLVVEVLLPFLHLLKNQFGNQEKTGDKIL